MVTSEMNDQIRYDAHTKATFDFYKHKNEWTDNNISSINWKAIGHAKNRIDPAMLHGWLNVGTQKLLIDEATMDGMCPCCGGEIEDHVHLYHCPNDDMRECLEQGLDDMVKTFHKENMPPQISLAYVDCLRRITHSTREKKAYHCPHADKAVDLQDHLGSFAILRGHHHIQWAYSILDTYKPPCAPPGNKPPRNRSPFELFVLLVEATWHLFDSLWETRNNILH
ncbi:hypothetical protein ACHAWF_003347 [Thalassiosira exigua]